MANRSGRSAGVLAIVAVALLAVVATVIYLWQSEDHDDDPSAAEALASQIRSTGVTPYVVRLDGAVASDVRVEDGAVRVDYDGADGFFSYTLVLEKAPAGDLCGPEGSGEQEDGGSCASDGDRMSTEFEEMGSFSIRKGDTLVTLDNLVIEMDPGIATRAFRAIEKARPLTADDLARS